MTIATTTFLKLNQSHFNQEGDYMPAPSQKPVSESNDFYQHHFPYHFVAHHQYYPHHMHCTTPHNCDHHHHNNYGTTSNTTGGKSFAHHTYQTIGPSTISSTLYQEHHYAKPDNMGNIEIIDSKKPRNFDDMNNEI